MSSKLKALAGDTAIYGISSIIGRAVNFLLVPFYTSTKILSIAEFGIVSEMYAYVAVANVIYLYGMETTYFRFVSKDSSHDKVIFDTAVSSILFSTLLFSLLLVASATPIVNWLEFRGQERFIYLLAAVMGIDAVVAIPFAKLRYERKAIKFATLKLVNIFLNIGLNVFFLYFCKNVYEDNFLPGLKPVVSLIYNPDFSVEYVFISNLVANALYLVMLGKTLGRLKIRIDWNYLKPMFLYAYPLLFSQLAGVTNEMFSRMTLKKMLPDNFYPGLNNEEVLGIFAANYRLSIFMTLAIQAFRFAAEPFFFSQSTQSDSKRTYSRVLYYFVIAGIFAVLAISLNLDILKRFVLQNKTYWQGLHVIPILLVANLFLGIYYNLSIWFKVTDKTIYGTFISISAAVLTVVLNVIFIPYYGYEASATITLTVYLYMSVVVYWLGQKYYPVPYQISKMSLYFFTGIFLLVVGWYMPVESLVLRQILREIPVLTFILLVYFMERKKIRVTGN